MRTILFIISLIYISLSTLAKNLPDSSCCGGIDSVAASDGVLFIPAELECIPAYAYADRHDLHTVRFEEGSRCRSVGDFAFLGCSELSDITLPASLTSLGEGCFRECVSLSEITLPQGIKTIPAQCFSHCTALKTVTTVSQPEYIRQFAFIYCEALQQFDFGSRLRHIGNNAFSRCLSLQEATLPTSLTELESYAFSDCVSLKSAMLPANPSLLGELIFSGCQSLTSLTVLSPVPAEFDCGSFPLEPLDPEAYRRCSLIVAQGCTNRYAAAPAWSLFHHIVESENDVSEK